MNVLRRWLDPPEIVARKRRARTAGPRPRSKIFSEAGIAIPVGCVVPLAIAAAVLVGAGVLVGQRLQAVTVAPPDRVTVRVIDDGSAGGPKIVSTQIVPLR
jgi:hypothetical protein